MIILGLLLLQKFRGGKIHNVPPLTQKMGGPDPPVPPVFYTPDLPQVIIYFGRDYIIYPGTDSGCLSCLHIRKSAPTNCT